MSALVIMLIICWMPQTGSHLKEVWRIEKTVPLERCLMMDQVFAGGGSAAAITVRCTTPGASHDQR